MEERCLGFDGRWFERFDEFLVLNRDNCQFEVATGGVLKGEGETGREEGRERDRER